MTQRYFPRGTKRDPAYDRAQQSAGHRRRCPATGKVKYKTADKAMGDARRWAPEQVAYVRAYRCLWCRKFHTTTQQMRTQPKGAR